LPFDVKEINTINKSYDYSGNHNDVNLLFDTGVYNFTSCLYGNCYGFDNVITRFAGKALNTNALGNDFVNTQAVTICSWIYPKGWKEGVRKYIIEDSGDIPDHAVKVGPKQYGPGVLDFPVTHKVDIDTLPVLLWNLDHLTYEQISSIEELVIERLEPYCNDETYQKRLKGKNV
jgi:hypothetical protein